MERLVGIVLFLPVPLVLWLCTRQPLGALPSVVVGVIVMVTHRLYARPYALSRAHRRCLWTGGAASGESGVTVEEPLDIVAVLEHHAEPGSAVLLDCLTLWLSNLLHAGRDVDTQSQLLLESLATLKGPVVIVSNEVGLGVTPNNALSRRYLDHLGQLHQQIAAQAARVYFLVAGIATLIKHT